MLSWRITFSQVPGALGIACGLVVAGILAPKDTYFLPNAFFYWVPQLIVLLLLIPLRASAAVVAGVSFALAAYLAAFGAWVFTRQHPDSMAWLGYVFSFPGAALGALSGTLWLRDQPKMVPLAKGCVAAVAVLLWLTLNQALVCITVIYCGGK